MASAAARERVEQYFTRKATRPAWSARRLLGRPDENDETLRQHLIAAISGSARPDGSVGGSAIATIGAIHELMDLGAPAHSAAPLLDWIMALIGKPGAFSEGCSSARHSHRVCEHFLSGFFSPAPPTERAAPVTFGNGKAYRVESQARFALSAAALAAALRGGRGDHPSLARHLDSFRHLLDEWDRGGDHLPLDLLFAAIAAVAEAPARWQPLLGQLVDRAARPQLPDGTWQRADFFNALWALCLVPGPVADGVLDRAVPALLQRQRDDGSFGSVAQDERALIGLRVLVRLGARSG